MRHAAFRSPAQQPGCKSLHRCYYCPSSCSRNGDQIIAEYKHGMLTTKSRAINGFRPLGQPGGQGETILLQGTGGVSIMGLLIAKAAGARVIITSSSDEKLGRASRLGADEVINYKKHPDWDDEVLRLTNGEGVDIIFENGAARTTQKSFKCVAWCVAVSKHSRFHADTRANNTIEQGRTDQQHRLRFRQNRSARREGQHRCLRHPEELHA